MALIRLSIPAAIVTWFACALISLVYFSLPIGASEKAPLMVLAVASWVLPALLFGIHALAVHRFRIIALAGSLEICPRCEHMLRGLASSSQCPECGSPYDMEVVREFWTRGARLRDDLHAGFWAGQFASNTTWRQILFDGLFGIVLPVSYLVLDTWFFKGRLSDAIPVLAPLRWAFYSIVVLGVLALVARHGLRQRNATWSLVVAGTLLASAVAWFLFGCIAFILGALVVTSLLDPALLVPFLCSFVLLRSGIRGLPPVHRKITPTATLALVGGMALPVVVATVAGLLQSGP